MLYRRLKVIQTRAAQANKAEVEAEKMLMIYSEKLIIVT
jgi:hypothetical protein